MEKRTEYLFVYGTLRKGFQNSMHQPLVRNAVFAGKAESDRVHGDVFLLQEPGTVFQYLDAYEECTSADPEPTEFKREELDVRYQSGKMVKAWIYLYNLPTVGKRQITSGDYVESLKKGKGYGEE
jgi:gamma-glutamylcyclotransferase (GGCT)/AIG2-like uncharacterized protein YtfP